MTLADRVMALAIAVLWPGHRRRAVILKPGQGRLVGGLDTSREVKVLTISSLGYPGAARSGPGGGHWGRQLPLDTRHPEHRERHEHDGDDDQADEDHGLLPSGDPG